MSDAMVKTLHKAGVNNLQVFQAVLAERDTGSIRTDYKVVNIVGKASGFDQNDLAGLRMFRRAESITEVIVQESVARVLQGHFSAILLSPIT